MNTTENKINVVVFAEFSGMDHRDHFVLKKKFKMTDLRTYNEWYEVLQSEFTIPNDLRSFSDDDQASGDEPKAKKILEKLKKDKE